MLKFKFQISHKVHWSKFKFTKANLKLQCFASAGFHYCSYEINKDLY